MQIPTVLSSMFNALIFNAPTLMPQNSRSFKMHLEVRHGNIVGIRITDIQITELFNRPWWPSSLTYDVTAVKCCMVYNRVVRVWIFWIRSSSPFPAIWPERDVRGESRTKTMGIGNKSIMHKEAQNWTSVSSFQMLLPFEYVRKK